MNLSEKYLQDFLIRMTYHNIAIEHPSVTLDDTVAILLDHTIPLTVSASDRKLIENHRYTIELLLRKALNHENLSFELLFEMHFLLMKQIDPERGQFKTQPNNMKGSDFHTATPKDTPLLMKQCLDDINQQMAEELEQKAMISLVCHNNIILEHIQPFQTGNGLLIRLINNFLLLRKNIAPFIIKDTDRDEYRRLLMEQNAVEFSLFAEKQIAEEEKHILSFD